MTRAKNAIEQADRLIEKMYDRIWDHTGYVDGSRSLEESGTLEWMRRQRPKWLALEQAGVAMASMMIETLELFIWYMENDYGDDLTYEHLHRTYRQGVAGFQDICDSCIKSGDRKPEWPHAPSYWGPDRDVA